MDTCKTCRFGNFAHRGAERGQCRRFAPTTTVGQLEPTVRYSNPEMAEWPGVFPGDTCGEHRHNGSEAEVAALTNIVREMIFGDGTEDSFQRTIDLCNAARDRFGIEREVR